LNYWVFGDYYGFGASAHSYYNKNRYANVSSVSQYIDLINNKLLPIEISEFINPEKSLMEQIFLSLRAKGLDMSVLPKISKNVDAEISEYVNILIKNEYAIMESNLLKLTSKGFYLTDEISVKLDSLFD
jgi:oxygen-independent coproporphyrinogen-3 oxidase